MERWQQLIEECTRKLNDDPELSMDVAEELRSHLDARQAELEAAGKSPESSRKEAMEAFGSAEEIGSDLFTANFSRMRLRAKMKLVFKILLVPAILAALLLCFDYKVFLCSMLHSRSSKQYQEICRRLVAAPQTELERLICETESSPEKARFLWQTSPENLTYYATYINELAEKWPGDEEQILEALSFADTIDPGNAHFDYMRAAFYLSKGFHKEPYKSGYRLSITNISAMEKAIDHLRAGLRKPKLNSYEREIRTMRETALHIPADDMLGQFYLNEAYAPKTSTVWGHYADLASAATVYSGILIAEGKTEEAKELRDFCIPYAMQLNRAARSMPDLQAVYGILEHNRRAAEYGKDESRALRLKHMTDPFLSFWNTSRKISYREHIPGPLSKYGVHPYRVIQSPREIKYEVRILYTFTDAMILALQGGVTFLAIVVCAGIALYGVIRRKNLFLLFGAHSELLRALLLGLLLPLLCFFIFSRLGWTGGRDFPERPPVRGLFWAAFLMFGIPALYLTMSIRGMKRYWRMRNPERKLPVTTAALNLIPVLALMLLFMAAIMRPALGFERKYLIRQDRSFFNTAEGVPAALQRMTEQLKQEQQQAIEEN